MKVWCFSPQSGGVRIPPMHYEDIIAQAEIHAKKQKWYPNFKIQLRFKSQFCYLDGLEEGKEPFPVGRLRYFSSSGWSLAFYTYSNEKYQPCVFRDGKWFGTIENAIDICSMYFQ